MTFRYFWLLGICLSLWGGAAAMTTPAIDTTRQTCLQNAYHLLDEVVTIMQKHYYRRNSVHWESFVADARRDLEQSYSCDDVYQSISRCFLRLQETHSFIMPPSKTAVYNYDTARLQYEPSLPQLMGAINTELIDGNYAYLSVPWISTTDSLICHQIADSLQRSIAQLDAQGATHWIIDLRQNTGGNCWPMLAGLGPLTGDGVCGYFVTDDSRVPIRYQDGVAWCGRTARCVTLNNGYRLKNQPREIILLTGPQTTSAGELVALAFKGKDNVRFFGQPTAGLTTANTTYPLSDHSMLVLTVCREADRTGAVCEGPLLPDQWIKVPPKPATDIVKDEALQWLQARQAASASFENLHFNE